MVRKLGLFAIALAILFTLFSGARELWPQLSARVNPAQDAPAVALSPLERAEAMMKREDGEAPVLTERMDDLRGAVTLIEESAKGDGARAQEAQKFLALFQNAQEFGELMEQFDQVIAQSQNAPQESLVQLYLGRAALSLVRDPKGALKAYRRATELDPTQMLAFVRIGDIEGLAVKDYDAAQWAFVTAFSLAEERQDLKVQAIAARNLGAVAFMKQDLRTAEKLYDKSLSIDSNPKNKKLVAERYAQLANLQFMSKNNRESAKVLLKKSIALFEELGNKSGLADNYFQLGVLESADERMRLWQKSRDIHMELGRDVMAQAVQAAIDAE